VNCNPLKYLIKPKRIASQIYSNNNNNDGSDEDDDDDDDDDNT